MVKLKSEMMVNTDGFNLNKYIAENFGNIAKVNANHEIEVSESKLSDGSCWGDHTDFENAEYLINTIGADGFNDIKRI